VVRPSLVVALVCAVTLTLGGCSTTPEAKAVKLTFASWVNITSEQQAFMDEVASKSGGTITFTPLDNWTEPDGVEKISDEQAMALAMAAGKIDVGWTSTRSFPDLGIDGFRAIEAPFLIQNVAGENQIVSGSIGEDILDALHSSDLTGLSLYPGPLRFPLTNGAPLLQPTDWAGKRIQYYGDKDANSIQARAISALGGVPVYDGLHIIDDLNAGTYDGGLDNLYDVASGGATAKGPFVSSNVVFWPSIYLYVANTDKLASLEPSQRKIIIDAARHAAELELEANTVDPSIGQSDCSAGARFGTASPEQLASLRASVQPVYDWLKRDAQEAPLLANLEAIALNNPTADAVAVPGGCSWK
jgi:TRAP-type C4-dicarboxylate transport system substrate-binding protein